MKKIILYFDELLFANGIYSWALSFCNAFSKDYDITVLIKEWGMQCIFGNNVAAEFYKSTKKYEADVVIHSYYFKPLPTNIKGSKIYTLLHCDYKQGEFDPNLNYIAVSQYAAKQFTKRYGIACDFVDGLLIREPQISKTLHLISCVRADKNKGIERMEQFGELLRDEKILYTWENYCDKDLRTMLYHSDLFRMNKAVPEKDLLNKIADADYLVALSSSEGFCRAVHQALLVGTPCIVTDIPIFRDVIKDGYNGYRVPLNMQDIDVQKIVQNIPRDFIYGDRYEETKSRWKQILNR